VLDVLNRLYQERDPEIAFHSYCRQGLCAGCLVEVDGRRCLACRTPAHDDMEIRPVLGSSSEDGLGG
jgi:succinate dehydrogenase/fumarate reductase-like Fe-S protein